MNRLLVLLISAVVSGPASNLATPTGQDGDRRQTRQLWPSVGHQQAQHPAYFYQSFQPYNTARYYPNSVGFDEPHFADLSARFLNNASVGADERYLSWNGNAAFPNEQQVQSRQNLFGLSNINSAVNPWASLFSRVPSIFVRNPEAPNLLNQYDSCTDPSGLSGICAPSFVCSGYGGRPSGACGPFSVCCINSLTKCGGQITLNNTYWQSPSSISSGSSCGLTVTLDSNLVEQKRRICQIRLDFLSFSIAQPNAQTACSTDTFQIGGATNRIPVICGDNIGQHMYLQAPSSTTDLQLLFNFGQSTTSRSWVIKIAMLPCSASYLAPKDCLQYFSATSGSVQSFNWRDVAGAATRQLANQDYNICFRSELIGGQQGSALCFSACPVSTAALPFSVSAPAGTSQAAPADCNNDFLLIPNGYNPAVGNTPGIPVTNVNDRYCGEALNVALGAAPPSASVCTQVKPFTVYYKTNGDETVTATVDVANVGNMGFCFTFQQRLN